MKPPFFAKAGQHTDIAALKQAWLAQVDVDGRREDGALTSVDNRIDSRTASVALRAEFITRSTVCCRAATSRFSSGRSSLGAR